VREHRSERQRARSGPSAERRPGYGGIRLDDNLICVDCGRAHGIFCQLLIERGARYEGDAGRYEGDAGR
jgi:hypothetical protein